MWMQSWPPFEYTARSAPGTARARLASSSTIMAFLPPSSAEKSMRRAAACWATVLPVAVLPVNIRKSTASMSGCPRLAPRPVTTCARPMGSPASSSRPTAHRAENGVCASGLMITPLPATKAGRASVMPSVSG